MLTMTHSAVIKRRRLLAAFGVGAAAVAGLHWHRDSPEEDAPVSPEPKQADPKPSKRGAEPDINAIVAENRHQGSAEWRGGRQGTVASDDVGRQIQGYASATSVLTGESIDFHVSASATQACLVEVYRLGWYGGAGARRVREGHRIEVGNQRTPSADPETGTLACAWPASWRLNVPKTWTSGLYMAVMTSESKFRACVPFVVRAPGGRLCVVLPFSTYQAYNPWPMDHSTGKSLYYGYSSGGETDDDSRAKEVSFDRPYPGGGVPDALGKDHEFVRWAEARGYDLTYATSIDLHAGRVDPKAFAGIVFPGHDEYWSPEMREVAEAAVEQGVHLAFLSANNVYWRVRFTPSEDGAADRVMACYKTSRDPEHSKGGRTTKWRGDEGSGPHSEQGLLGVQYNGIVDEPQPLVVANASHWFWSGCDVSDGDSIPKVVGGEADGFDESAPQPPALDSVLLSRSPFLTPDGTPQRQNTHLHEAPSGALVFAAGSIYWPLALNRAGYVDARIQRATSNVFARMLA